MALTTSAMAIGVDAQGRWPLPWLRGAMAHARSLSRAHAVLVHGPAGAGQLELALLMAQGWLCESPDETAAPVPPSAAGAGSSARPSPCQRTWSRGPEPPEGLSQPGSGPALTHEDAPIAPCGRCVSCHLVRMRVHPDLLIVVPDALRAKLGWLADDEGSGGKSEAKPSSDIRVQQVRQAIDWSRNTSGRGGGKALLLHPADALNATAASALLKTLEEPPGALRLVLTSVDPQRLLPTVRSRCQRLPLELPPVEQAQAWLIEQGLSSPGDLLALCAGSPIEAMALAEEGITAQWRVDLPRRVAAADASMLRGRPLPRVVDLLAKLAHDVMAVAVGAAPRFYAAQSLPPSVDVAAWVSWQKSLLQTARHDEHPWNSPLLIETLVTQGAALWPQPPTHRPAPGGAWLHSGR